MNSAIGGIVLLIIAGVMNGSFTLPMKFTKQWQWENTWLVWTIWALVIFPPVLTLATIPHVGSVYGSMAPEVVLTVAACGAGWGISQVFFGLAVESVGIALAFSVILGLSAAVGSLVPLIRSKSATMFTQQGVLVMCGVALVLTGVGICAVAGRKREAKLGKSVAAQKASLAQGLLFCIVSGVGSALVGIGFDSGKAASDAARQFGASALWSPMAIWLPLMMAGGIPNLIYTIYLVRKNRTGNLFQLPATGSYWLLAGIMGVFWFGSTLMYGIAVSPLGTSVAWPIFMSLIVIVASIWGVLTGEWRGTGKRPLQIMYGGVAVLVLAIYVLSKAA
jgi:L-rhamnose-H+ transport protein